MNTVVLKLARLFRWGGGFFLVLALVSACQQKCQPPVTQKFKTLAETQWRMVETSDPSVKGLDRFNFLIFNFSRNFSGNIQQVRYNDLFETPYKTFNWNIDKDTGQLIIRSQAVAPPADATQSGGASGQPSTNRSSATDEKYDYNLGRELELTDQKGHYFRFVPFTGVVDPDSACTF